MMGETLRYPDDLDLAHSEWHERPRCPRCGGDRIDRSVVVEARSMQPVPRQVERFVRITRWQCASVEAHAGQFQTPTEER